MFATREVFIIAHCFLPVAVSRQIWVISSMKGHVIVLKADFNVKVDILSNITWSDIVK